MTTALRLGLTAILVTGACGGTASTRNSASASPAQIGEMVRGENWEFVVLKYNRDPPLGGFVEQAKGLYFGVAFSLTNIGKRNFGIGPQDFELVSRNGVVYDPSLVASSSYVVLLKNLGATRTVELSSLDQYPPGLTFTTGLVFDINPASLQLDFVFLQAGNRRVQLR